MLDIFAYLCVNMNSKTWFYELQRIDRPLEIHDKERFSRLSSHPYGSEARGEAKQNSDIDILILVDKDVLSPVEEDVITAPIYDLEIETGTVISPIVMTRKAWDAAKRKTMFYYNVMKDGVLL